MEKYFFIGEFAVVEYKDKSFAPYTVTNTNRCFHELEEAILYAIGCHFGKRTDQELMVMCDTFLTMAKK